MSAVTQSTNEPEQYRSEYGQQCDYPISEAVVDAVAAAEGVEPTELTARLHDSIDTDALDRLYESATERGEDLRLAFTFGEYEVVIESERPVLVRESSEDPSR